VQALNRKLAFIEKSDSKKAEELRLLKRQIARLKKKSEKA
jgi:hypothetical protein